MDSDYLGGILSMLVTTVFFGSMFVPIKPYETRDGFFVMWVETIGVFFLGAIVNVYQAYPQFYTWAAVAGAIWTTGNICVVPIVNALGSGLGFLIWGSVQIVFGWATARFGWFGLGAEVPRSDAMMYAGVALTVGSAVMFALVRNNDGGGGGAGKAISVDAESDSAPAAGANGENPNPVNCAPGELQVFVQHRSTAQSTVPPLAHAAESPQAEAAVGRKQWWRRKGTKIRGISLAVFAGMMFGAYMTPITYMQTKVENAPQEGLDYAFAFSTGAVLAATVYFAAYCAVTRNRPYVNERTAVPSLVYGLMWATAQFSWFYGNGKLSQSISYPIASRAPAILAAVWGVFYFKEVQGTKNLLMLLCACVVALVGVVCVGLANQVDL